MKLRLATTNPDEMGTHIPFNRLSIEGRERDYIETAVLNMHASGDGPFTNKCRELLKEQLGVAEVLLTPSCTHALEMAALLLNLRSSDEIIVPSFTFVSTANAFALTGAKLVFIDSRSDTLNMDETQLETLITHRTKAIVPVHYAGVGCEMDVVMATAQERNIAVVEDNAHGLFGRYRGQQLGTFGCLATQSFHETKNITCGEGGALIVNDRSLIDRARVIRDKGTNREQFLTGQVDKYTWVDIGSSFVMSDLLAAFLFAQLEERKKIQDKREAVWKYYSENLTGWAEQIGATLPVIPTYCEQAYHMFYVLMPTKDARDKLLMHLQARDICAVFHYVPLHSSPMGQRLGGRVGQCPIAEKISGELLRLPFYTRMRQAEQDRVIDAILEF